ncbi:hypothetical protein BGW36DRAFT_461286 [Talaromyces proteolyticus]|uniref:RRM domain-containing protein n=1 Tax=Talaromyces proteolyticus TaxID=1131652 RepID=A0AAD4KP52_9EURO|nr:uncharacterized protein BGW36DRAFT_461286 [Talaromyces proteolyticus]KAH8697268.1 hypothetical protein BGW36DRAFT_461286 [Talaromyces proteolyticus]
MAPEKKEKKRKATAPTDPPAKKSKKVSASEKSADLAPSKSILKEKSTVSESNGVELSSNGDSTRKAKPRKRASDFLSDDDEGEEKTVEVAKKQESEKGASKKTKSKVDTVDVDVEVEGSSDGDEIDDQTAELIKGFESSGDEDASGDEGLEDGQPVPRIPDSKKTKRKIQKKLKNNEEPEEPGTVYVGRIPHGFYEHQMRAYFSQFGDITRLRLSRNRVTGRSKHYAFIEFASATVAKIVAETMNNYLMYGHILKCKYVPQEQQHAELWKGANRRFKPVPWNKIDKQHLERGKSREKWTKNIQQEEKRRLAKAEKMKALGYEIELPTLTSVDQVPVQKALASTTVESEQKTIENTPKEAKERETKEIEAKTETKAEETTEKTTKSAKKANKTNKAAKAKKAKA